MSNTLANAAHALEVAARRADSLAAAAWKDAFSLQDPDWAAAARADASALTAAARALEDAARALEVAARRADSPAAAAIDEARDALAYAASLATDITAITEARYALSDYD